MFQAPSRAWIGPFSFPLVLLPCPSCHRQYPNTLEHSCYKSQSEHWYSPRISIQLVTAHTACSKDDFRSKMIATQSYRNIILAYSWSMRNEYLLLNGSISRIVDSAMYRERKRESSNHQNLSVHRISFLRFFFHEINMPQNIRFVGFHNASIHDHFVQQKMDLLQLVHNVQLANRPSPFVHGFNECMDELQQTKFVFRVFFFLWARFGTNDEK
jgi:hypothetical protein